ncbi:hypothetical protein ACIP4X_29835 [Streptomyces sp. NPDC088817]
MELQAAWGVAVGGNWLPGEPVSGVLGEPAHRGQKAGTLVGEL